MDGVDTIHLGRDGQEDRHDHDQPGDPVDDGADQQQDHQHQQKEGRRRLGHGFDPCGDGLRHLAKDQHPGKDARRRHQKQHQRRVDAGAQQDGAEIAEFEGLGEEQAQDRGAKRTQGRRLGRRAVAAQDGADDDGGDQQHRQGIAQRDKARGPADAFAARIVMPAPQEGNRADEQAGQQQPRQQPCQQHVAHCQLGQHSIDDKDDGGRDDRPQQPAEGRYGGREVAAIAGLLHLGDHDLCHHCDLRRGRAEDRGDHHVRDEVDIGQPPLEVANKDRRQPDQPLGDAGAVHQLSDQDEQRDGQQAEIVERAEELQPIAVQQNGIARGLDEDECRGAEHQSDGQADQHEKEKGKGGHWVTSMARPAGSSGRVSRPISSHRLVRAWIVIATAK